MSVNIPSRPVAYSYLRFSTPEQMKGDSFRRQLDATKRYTDEHGLVLNEALTFHDLGISAFHGANLDSALGLFLEAIDKGHISPGSFLIVESLDRLSRQAPHKAYSQFSAIINRGINVVTLQDGKVYDESPDFGDLIYSLVSMQRAHEESLVKSQRLSAAWKQKRRIASAEGVPLTSKS